MLTLLLLLPVCKLLFSMLSSDKQVRRAMRCTVCLEANVCFESVVGHLMISTLVHFNILDFSSFSVLFHLDKTAAGVCVVWCVVCTAT